MKVRGHRNENKRNRRISETVFVKVCMEILLF